MRKRKLQSAKGNNKTKPAKADTTKQNNDDVESLLTCTFVKTSLENDELEVAFKVRSVLGNTVFKLFQEGVVRFEAVSTSLKSIKKQGLCLGCGALTNLIQKILTFSVGVDEIQSHCSNCSISSPKKAQLLTEEPESVKEQDCDISEEKITTPEIDYENYELPSIRASEPEEEVNKSQISVTQTPELVGKPQISVTQTPELVGKPQISVTQTPELVGKPQIPVTQTPELVGKPQISVTQTQDSIVKTGKSFSQIPDSVGKTEKSVGQAETSPKFTARKLRERKGNKITAKLKELSSDVDDFDVEDNVPSASDSCENRIELENELTLVEQNTSQNDLTREVTLEAGDPVPSQNNIGSVNLVLVKSPRKKSPLKCEICGKTLLNKKTLTSHLKTHTAESSFVCKVCNRTFSCIRYLKKHEKTHTKEKPYSCEICGQRFKLKETLPKHMILHKEQKPYQCFICEKQFHLEKQLKMHLPIHTEERKFICELCGKRFRTQGSMKSHKATHDGPQRHSCEQCGKSYRSVWYLKIHQKTHTGQNLIQCPDCKDWFIDPCYFKLHQKKFCKAKPLLCSTCGLEFPHNQALQSHMGLHTGERPYGCNCCGKAFAKSSLLAEHMKRHTLKDCLKCQHCSKSFINKKELLRHEKIHSTKKKKAYLPESLKPKLAEEQEQEQEQDQNQNHDQVSTQDLEEEVVMEVDSVNNHAQEITVGSLLNPNEYIPVVPIQDTHATAYDGCIKFLQNRNSSYTPRTDSSVAVTDNTGASTQILSSRGGHITVHEPVTISNFFPSSVDSQNIHFSGSYSIPHTSSSAMSQSTIVSTPEGEELQSLQPISMSSGVSVVYETEATVQHLLQAAAIMKDY